MLYYLLNRSQEKNCYIIIKFKLFIDGKDYIYIVILVKYLTGL